jgi:gamma-glutamylcyclotransferase (GGCT)/AIG2-like uncharacterized protein YtfP
MNPHLFVYGSLRHQTNSKMALFLKAHAQWLSTGKIEAKLYAVSWYAAAVLAKGSYVIGEVWKILNPKDVFLTLDAYEEAPLLFVRKEVDVYCSDGNTLKAWVYFYNLPVDNHHQIASGDFLNP